MFFRSMRFKMMLWYAIIFTLTLSAFSLLIYGNFSNKIYDDLDDLLASKAEGVANSISTYMRIKEIEAAQNKQLSKVSDGSSRENFIEVARDWVDTKIKDPDLMNIFTRIIDPAQEVIVSSKLMLNISPLPGEDFDAILSGEDSFDTLPGKSVDGKNLKFRVYTKPVIEDGVVVYIVQVVGSTKLLSVALANLRFILFVLFPLIILFACIPSIFLIKAALNPIDKMIGTLKKITAGNLKLKIHIPDTRDEMKRLADTFNDMIERLDRSFSSQQKFIEDISEELRTPVGLLEKDIRAALEKAHTGEEYRTLLQNNLKGVGDFSETIENLRILSQLDNGQVLLKIMKVDLAGLMEDVMKNIRPLADEKSIDLASYCHEEIVLDGDRSQLMTLFTNILDNAVKYTYRNGKIVVTSEIIAKSAKITVSDTGAGMPEEELNYIFDRFYQVKKSRIPRNGFGLGLSIAKTIVEEHKGSIAVTSKIGQGSVFIVSLPLLYPG